MKSLQVLLLVCLLGIGISIPVNGARRKSDKGPHPLKILKVVQDGSSRSTMNGCNGRYHIWLQNVTDVAVDKVEIQMEIYSTNGRLVDTIKKEVGTLDSGNKNMAEVRYDVIGEASIRPRFWVLYNAGKDQPAQFEITGTSWNF